jgi:Carboxypeptidase regulatory-like domain
MSARRVIAVLCIVVAWGFGPAKRGAASPRGAQPPQSAQPPVAVTGTAILRGHVYDADGGRPLRGALVRVNAVEGRANHATVTDVQGQWEIGELPAAHYLINVSKGNYIGLSYGQRRAGDSPTPLAVVDGQTVEKLDVMLAKGGVITGHIADEYGDPVPNAMVSGLRSQYVQGRRRFSPAGMAQTDDLGEYRLFGLGPGNYYISATYRQASGPASGNDAPGYAVTFFPGVPGSAGAQRVTIGMSESHDEVNIALVRVKTAQISGTAVKSSGEPIAGGFVSMTSTESEFPGLPGGQIRPDGTFVIRGVVPGTYRLQAQIPGSGDRNQRPQIASTIVSVAGSDVDGVQLAVPTPASIAGTVLVDPAATATMKAGAISVTVTYNDLSFMTSNASRVADDYTFEMPVTPGHNIIGANGLGPSTSVRAIRLNGIDITESGIDLRPGQNVGGIEIELNSHPSVVSGLVTDSSGATSKGSTVLVFARDESKWQGLSRYVRVTRTDQDGKFSVSGLPPGDYYAVAMTSVNTDEITDPEQLTQIRDHAMPLSLNDAETKVLDLKVTP